MKNNLTDLNNYLFEQIERLQDDNLSDEQLEKEIKRNKAITEIAEQIVSNGELALKTYRYLYENGFDVQAPALLEDHDVK